VQSIFTEGMTFQQQGDHFSSASIILAGHGSALGGCRFAVPPRRCYCSCSCASQLMCSWLAQPTTYLHILGRW
jgi:hypothetical protein